MPAGDGVSVGLRSARFDLHWKSNDAFKPKCGFIVNDNSCSCKQVFD